MNRPFRDLLLELSLGLIVGAGIGLVLLILLAQV